MIPKIIHLCWFSNDEFPPKIQQCIDSWKRILPDYQIKTWNYEMAASTGIPFVLEALSRKKWAFAADVIRLYALYTEGGVYMDSDIFLKSRFDHLLTNKTVFFNEYFPEDFQKFPSAHFIDEEGKRIQEGCIRAFGIQAALFMSEKESPFIKHLIDVYGQMNFIQPNGELYMDIIAPNIYSQELEQLGYYYNDTRVQQLGDITVYPSKYVASGMSQNNKDAFAIHFCDHSWYEYSFQERMRSNVIKMVERILGRKLVKKIKKMMGRKSEDISSLI